MTSTMRVAILADVRLHGEGLADVLGRQRGIDVVAATTTSPADIESVRVLLPDVALLDSTARDGIDVLRTLTAALPGVKVVVLGLPETEPHVLACAEHGIAGYVAPDGTAGDLVQALWAGFAGEAVCPPWVAGSLFRRVAALAGEQRPGLPSPQLTLRETQVADLLGQGLSNREIAARLYIELSTVKNHVHSILEKLRMRRRFEAGAWAAGQGTR